MWLPTKQMVNTAVRYATAVAGTAFTILGLQSKGISLDQVKVVIQALGDTANSLVILAGALAAIWAGTKGVVQSTPSAQTQSLKETMANPSTSTETKQAIIAGATDAVATAAASENAAVAHAAKVALLDNTAALPEVKNDIIVTDRALAADTASAQVKAAA